MMLLFLGIYAEGEISRCLQFSNDVKIKVQLYIEKKPNVAKC